jgi:hypothetical protein
MSLVDDLLPVFGTVRSIPGSLGLNPFTLEVVVRTWTGGRPGVGTVTETATTILERGQNPDVEQVSTREIIASAGLYRDQDLRVGPLTPPWTDPVDSSTGGTALTTLDPAPPAGASMFYRLHGPGLPSGGALYKKVELHVTDPTGYLLVLRKTGEGPA